MHQRRGNPPKPRKPATAFALFAAATMLSGAFLMPAAFAQADPRESSLRAAEHARFAAQVDANAKVLEQLLDDDLDYVHSNGELDCKKSFIVSLTSGRRDYVSMVGDIESVRIFGDVAVILGKAKVTVADSGAPINLHIGYTDVWLWKNGRWQMTSWRSARLPDSKVK